MGFSTLLDILGSIIVGGLLFMILLRMNDAAVKNTYINAGDLIVQQSLVELVTVLEYDFRKIGYCADWENVPPSSQAIIQADSNRITYLTDTNSDGTLDTMHYYLGPISELASTPNPRDRILYRVVNNATPRGANLGVTSFNMVYYDPLGDTLHFPISQPGQIYTIEINLVVENYTAYDNEYNTAFWKQIRLAARNLQNR